MSTDPFFGRNPVVNAMQAQRGRNEAIRENRARQAYSYAQFTTEGSGEFMSPEVVRFDVTFLRQPVVSTGFYVDGDSLVKGRFPRVTAGVFRWDTDKRGYFTGCWVFFAIDTSGPDTDPGEYTLDKPPPVYSLVHNFTFAGTGVKDLPAHELER